MPHPSQTAQHTPHKPAIIMGNSGEVVSYRELDERSNQRGAAVSVPGPREGRSHRPDAGQPARVSGDLLGAQRAGLIYTPISTHLREEETAYILGNCGAGLFIVAHDLAEVAARMLDAAFSVQHFFMLGGVVDGLEPLGGGAGATARDADRRPGERRADALLLGHHGQAQGRVRGPGLRRRAGAPSSGAVLRRRVRVRRGDGLPVAGAALPRGAAALQHDDPVARRARRWSWKRSTPSAPWP
jgi:hypothetical protein